MNMTAEQVSDLDEAIAAAELLAGNVDALRSLNRRVIELIRDADRQEGQKFLSSFKVGDRVWWDSKKGRRRIYGRIVRINPKSVGIDGEDGSRWRVHWSFLNFADDQDTRGAKDGDVFRALGRVIR
jgi:hypothetical protein